MPLIASEVGFDFEWYHVPDEYLTPCQSAIQRHLRDFAFILAQFAHNLRPQIVMSEAVQKSCSPDRQHGCHQIGVGVLGLWERWKTITHLIVQWVQNCM
jgi:hypothetical protein